MGLTKRWPVTLLGATGALIAAIGGNVAGVPEVTGVGWAAVAGIALSLMLHSWGLRVTGVLVVAVGVLGGVLSLLTDWWFAVAFLLVVLAGVLIGVRGPAWASTRRPRQSSDDLWKQLDAGEDPTA